MNTQIINPASEQEWLRLRTLDVTSTEVSSLFGISPYCTAFELWQRKKEAKVVQLELEEWATWGKRLQDAIAAGVAEDQKWKIRRMDEYIRIPELRMGSSFDFSIEHIMDPKEGEYLPNDVNTLLGLLEIKNVFGMIFKDQWLEDEEGHIEAPPHIEIQVQHQLAVSGRAFAYIAALVSGNQIHLMKRLPNERIIEAIKKRVAEFWASIEAGTPPPPDFAKDAEFIASVFSYAEPGKIFDARNDVEISTLAQRDRELKDAIKVMDEERSAIKSQLLMAIGDAEKVLGNGFSISAGLVGPAHVSYDRQGYRMFKLNWPRSKK